MDLFGLALTRALALRTVTRPGAIEALTSVTRSLAYGALSGSAADVALHSWLFFHADSFSTRPPVQVTALSLCNSSAARAGLR
jgi:hypothetical protein